MKTPSLTLVRSASSNANFICPRCGVEASREAIVAAGYLCPRCRTEAAHLDVLPNGSIRGVFGWLRSKGEVVNERYRVESLLGRGGFGATYLVEDLNLAGRRRALKEVAAALDDGEEAQILSRLRHPAIPDIIDRFNGDGLVSLVLEFGGNRTMEGERRECGGRVPVDRVMRWAVELCDVLGYLHGQRPAITHRDLKPENVLLDAEDHVMLVDFGIAKEAREDTSTRTAARCATHGFSPPEQVLGTGTDPRSDIYSLGATLYALLTGEVPAAAHERVAGRPLLPPRSLCPSIPQSIEEAIVKALELNVNLRPQTVEEFRCALTEEPNPGRRLLGLALGKVSGSQTIRLERRKAGDGSEKGIPPSDALGNRRVRLWTVLGLTILLLGAVGGSIVWLRVLGISVRSAPVITPERSTTPMPSPTPESSSTAWTPVTAAVKPTQPPTPNQAGTALGDRTPRTESGDQGRGDPWVNAPTGQGATNPSPGGSARQGH